MREQSQRLDESREPCAVIAGRYYLRQQIGTGMLSSVYKAEDRQRPGEIFAVKLFNTNHADALRKEMFRRETSALQNLNHPYIIRIQDHGWSEVNNCFFIVFDYFNETLSQFIESQHDARNDTRRWRFMLWLAEAITHAHGAEVIHRDIKPSNILIDERGRPKLTDFGTSKIKHDLSIGLTVSHLWSAGYAAPEQRRSGVTDERSDIFSLGAVYYHLLTGSAPPGSGPTPTMANALQAPPAIRAIVARMLAENPDDRFATALDLVRALQVLDQFTPLPEILLVATEYARNNLYEIKAIHDPSFTTAQAWLLEQLGKQDVHPVHVLLQGNETVLFLTNEVRIQCVPDKASPALIITGADFPWGPNLEAQRTAAKQLSPFSFKLIRNFNRDNYTDSQVDVYSHNKAQLLDWLAHHNRRQEVQRDRRATRREFLDTWDSVLRYQRNLVDSQEALEYASVKQEAGFATFTLKNVFPDSLKWQPGSIVVLVDARGHESEIGTYISNDAKTIIIGQDGSTARSDSLDSFPLSGKLSLSRSEERAAIRRQQDALDQLKAGNSVNPRLIDVLTDLRRAEVDPLDEDLKFRQDNLAPDKQAAVREALASKDIYLLQGPPGTGKTAAITEIILQILDREPNARILVSSQSNVAVDHVLSQLKDYYVGQNPEFVRIGRSEKIGYGAQHWSLDQRLSRWRDEVVQHCMGVLSVIEREIQQLRSLTKGQAAIQDCSEWLEEADSLAQHLQQNQQTITQYQSAHQSTSDANAQRIRENLAAMTEEIAIQRETLAGHLAAIRALLPDIMEHDPLIDPLAEHACIVEVRQRLLQSEVLMDRLQERQKLIKGWCEVFGYLNEFKAPLLERANVLAATCLYVGTRLLKDVTFDYAIVDEAGRATAPEILVALVRAKRAIIVGDEKQLPPHLDDDLDQARLSRAGLSREGLDKSLFETLVEDANEHHREIVRSLKVQHRMHPAIGELVSHVFYDHLLEHATTRDDRDHGLSWIPKPIAWMSTSKLANRFETSRKTSYANPAEVAVVADLLERMEATYRGQGSRRHVAVISGYAGQIEELQDRLAVQDRERWMSLDIEPATIDSFQGRDCDIVIYSAVRSNTRGNLGFLQDWRRLNVALSRARELLCIVGDIRMLGEANTKNARNPFEDIIHYIHAHPDDCMVMDMEGSNG